MGTLVAGPHVHVALSVTAVLVWKLVEAASCGTEYCICQPQSVDVSPVICTIPSCSTLPLLPAPPPPPTPINIQGRNPKHTIHHDSSSYDLLPILLTPFIITSHAIHLDEDSWWISRCRLCDLELLCDLDCLDMTCKVDWVLKTNN